MRQQRIGKATSKCHLLGESFHSMRSAARELGMAYNAVFMRVAERKIDFALVNGFPFISEATLNGERTKRGETAFFYHAKTKGGKMVILFSDSELLSYMKTHREAKITALPWREGTCSFVGREFLALEGIIISAIPVGANAPESPSAFLCRLNFLAKRWRIKGGAFGTCVDGRYEFLAPVKISQKTFAALKAAFALDPASAVRKIFGIELENY